jgi:hypothetical protein
MWDGQEDETGKDMRYMTTERHVELTLMRDV